MQVTENKKVKLGQIPEELRCSYLFPDGRRCKNRRWREREVCFHHDPEAAELRKNPGQPVSRLRVLTATEVQEVLAETLAELRAGRLPVGRAYAIGYLGQLLLGNLEAVGKEYDWVKSEYDRYHREIYRRVRALDEGRYEKKEAEEAEEAQEAEDGEE